MYSQTFHVSHWVYGLLIFTFLLHKNPVLGKEESRSALDLYRQAKDIYHVAPEEAIALAKKAVEAAISSDDARSMANAYFLLGYLYKNLDDIPNAFRFYFGAIRIYSKIGDDFRVQQLYENLAYISEAKGVHVIAEQLRKDRLNYVDRVEYQVKVDMHYDLGLSLKHLGELEKAMSSQLEALKILKQYGDLGDTTSFAKVWLELGILNHHQAIETGDYSILDTATRYYNRSEHFNSGDSIHLGKIANNRGDIHRLHGSYDMAKAFLRHSLDLAGSHDQKKITPYYNLGRVYWELEEKDSAIWALTQSLQINIRDLSFIERQAIPQLNIELSKAAELFGAIALLDSLGMEALEIRGQAMRFIYRMAKDRYEIVGANNRSMLAQLYEEHSRELAEEEHGDALKTWSVALLLIFSLCAAAWSWWRRYSARKALHHQATQIEKRLKKRYGLDI